MNEYNNESNARPVTPYKATGNLNTAIGNPSVNINDTMNVNIQSMSTSGGISQSMNNINTVQNSQIQNNNVSGNVYVNNQNMQNTSIPSLQNVVTNTPVNNIQVDSIMDANSTYINTNQTVNNEIVNNQSSGVQRTYVTMDNKPKKKTLSISLGPEFKMGLLIIVILLVFVLFLPMISDFLNGY